MISFASSRLRSQMIAAALSVPAIILSGCGMGPMNVSSVDPTPTQVSVNVSGLVHGGQQAVSYSTLQIWAVGSGSYGAAATELTTAASGTNEYYPGGTKGCNPTAVSVTHVSISGGTATFTAANTMKVGQLVTINDGDGLSITGSTLQVTAATSTTFGVPDSIDTGQGGDTGTATPTCYTKPVTDQNGNFTLSGDYTVPGTAAQTYITATGGNPGLTPVTTNNTAIKMVAPLGLSSSLGSGTFVIINEISTTAMAFAAGQYFTTTYGSASTDSFGSTSTTQGQLGLTNALATVGNLASVSTGTPQGLQVVGNATTGTVTVTPDISKIALIADILAACINSAGPTSTACSEIFADVTPTYAPGTTTAATVATDTLQAAVYMSLNPTSTNASSSTTNMTQLFGLATASSPFASYHTGYTQPTDWTIGVSYGLSTANSSSAYALSEPQWFAFDASGNLWITNYSSSNLTELSPTGVPLYSSSSEIGVSAPYSVVVDTNGNVWTINNYAATGNLGSSAPKQVVEYTSGTFNEVATTNTPYALAADGKGDIFVLEGANNTVEEIASGASSVTTVASTGLTLSKYGTIAVDSNYNLWITSGGSNTTIYEIPYSAGSYGSPVTVTNANLVEGEPMAIDGSNNVWVGNYSTTAPSAAKIPAATPTGGSQYAVTGATGGLEGVAIDGGGNVWLSNYSTGTNGFYELSSSGTELSPSTGWAHTTHDGKAIAVDPSGNVWIGGTATNTSSTELVELVGGGVPVVTPIAAGLPATAGGTNKLGSKP